MRRDMLGNAAVVQKNSLKTQQDYWLFEILGKNKIISCLNSYFLGKTKIISCLNS